MLLKCMCNNISIENKKLLLRSFLYKKKRKRVLVLPDTVTGHRWTQKVVKLCNDVGVMVQVRDIEAFYKLFQKKNNNQLHKRTIVRFVNRRFAEDLLSKRNISLTLDLNKLRFPRGTQIYFNANLCGYYKRMSYMSKELKKIGRIKYFWKRSGSIKIRRVSETAVIKILHQRDLEIESSKTVFKVDFGK